MHDNTVQQLGLASICEAIYLHVVGVNEIERKALWGLKHGKTLVSFFL